MLKLFSLPAFSTFRLVAMASMAFALIVLAGCSTLASQSPGVTTVDPAPTAPWKSRLLLRNPLIGKIVDTRSGHTLSADELLARLRSAPVVLIGEKHDNPDHHRIEGWLIRQLVKPGTQVVFEMLDDRHKSALAGDLDSSITLPALKTALKWDGKSWSWNDYGPLFQQALQQHGNVVAGNIDRKLMMSVYKDGRPALKDKGRFQTVDAVSEQQGEALLDKVYESHCGKMPRAHLGGMVTIQIAKDASMADALATAVADARESGSGATPYALLLAGGAHQLKTQGVPQHLQLRGVDYVTLQLVEVEEGVRHWDDDPSVAEEADFLWFTPKFTDRDYCADLEKKS